MTTARGYDKNGSKLSSAGWPVRTAPRHQWILWRVHWDPSSMQLW